MPQELYWLLYVPLYTYRREIAERRRSAGLGIFCREMKHTRKAHNFRLAWTTIGLVRNVLGKTAVAVALCSLIPATSAMGEQPEGANATIVFVRHGEKPEGGLGQLNCQGLNRALALAPIIAKSFGRPDAIFAPNPSHPKEDAGGLYNYIRPLATIEPTAIWFGLPVDVSLDFQDIEGLQGALESRRVSDRNVFVLVAWEHRKIAPIVRALLAAHEADAEMVKKVKDWDRKDFDSMYVVTISKTKATFDQRHEGLDGQPDGCPR